MEKSDISLNDAVIYSKRLSVSQICDHLHRKPQKRRTLENRILNRAGQLFEWWLINVILANAKINQVLFVNLKYSSTVYASMRNGKNPNCVYFRSDLARLFSRDWYPFFYQPSIFIKSINCIRFLFRVIYRHQLYFICRKISNWMIFLELFSQHINCSDSNYSSLKQMHRIK